MQTFLDFSNLLLHNSTKIQIVCELCGTVIYRDGSIVSACNCKRDSNNSKYKVITVLTPGKQADDLKLEPESSGTSLMKRGLKIFTIYLNISKISTETF